MYCDSLLLREELISGVSGSLVPTLLWAVAQRRMRVDEAVELPMEAVYRATHKDAIPGTT